MWSGILRFGDSPNSPYARLFRNQTLMLLWSSPLYPALVTQRLHGDASAFGALEAVAVVGEAVKEGQ